MPSVIISWDSHFYKVIAIEGKTRIGRGQGNDVVLDAAGVSRKHAFIDQVEGDSHLTDEGSTKRSSATGRANRGHGHHGP